MTGALVALLLAGSAAPAAGSATIVREHIVIRVPLPRRPVAPPVIAWRESKGPRCILMGGVAGAAIAAPDSVDFVMRGGRRLRARLDRECPALDYYSGFYLVSTLDGRICADRDAVHARSGGACEIDRFRLLKPTR
jgi:hypothetical protein